MVLLHRSHPHFTHTPLTQIVLLYYLNQIMKVFFTSTILLVIFLCFLRSCNAQTSPQCNQDWQDIQLNTQSGTPALTVDGATGNVKIEQDLVYQGKSLSALLAAIKPPVTLFHTWGKTACPQNMSVEIEELYNGMMASSRYNVPGGMSTWLCLPLSIPAEFDSLSGTGGLFAYGTTISAVEYQTANGNHFKALNEREIPCATCQATTSMTHMFPMRLNCPGNWRKIYSGIMMTMSLSWGVSKEAICMHSEAEELPGSSTVNHDGALIYTVQLDCIDNPILCDNHAGFQQGRGVACVVCAAP